MTGVVLTTSTYSNPTWLTSISGAIVSGNIPGNATSITGSIVENQVTGLLADLAVKAPLNSPTFLGTPAAPTATTGTNTTQLATTAFVASAVATGVPVLSVFGRTGTVVPLGGDYSVGQITGAAPLVSPTLTGVPTAPTALIGTSTTQIATTAFVAAALPSVSVISVFGRTGTVVATTGDYSVGQITGAAPLASPTFTGVPTGPTATAGTNTIQLATTAFVTTAIGELEVFFRFLVEPAPLYLQPEIILLVKSLVRHLWQVQRLQGRRQHQRRQLEQTRHKLRRRLLSHRPLVEVV